MEIREQLLPRTRRFALAIIRLCEGLPKGQAAGVISKQLIRCGTSVGANYRAACHGKSKPDFIAKMGIVEEEIDESIYWIDLLIEAKLLSEERGTTAKQEAAEILAMVVASIKTARTSASR
jgi:four helix bundle protein